MELSTKRFLWTSGLSVNLILFLLFVSFQSRAEIKRDTLITKAYKDTSRIVKAQVIELDSGKSMLFYRPKPFQFVKNIPFDLANLGKAAVSKKNLPAMAGLITGTLFLVALDQPISNGAQQFGRYINLDPSHKFHRVELFNIPVIDLPGNLNAAFYFMGEGWPSIMIAGSFYGYGLIKHDYRAITTQVLKRISGRESPFVSTVPGGKWHPFQNPAYYQKHVAKSDAFPSGHMATAMATVTILAGNYPDNKFIKPIGYSLMGLLGFSMLNNGVHWISDYPLAIAIGYTCGKIALSRGSQIIPKISTDHGASSSFQPVYMGEGGIGLCYRATF
jgi:membrane-associated phospholipid phosphatase